METFFQIILGIIVYGGILLVIMSIFIVGSSGDKNYEEDQS